MHLGSLSQLQYAIILVAVLFMSSCQWLQKGSNNNDQILARVGDDYLYSSDVADLLSAAKDQTDSSKILDTYIENWVKKRLMIEKAELYLPSEDLDIEKRVQDYRESLLIYAYETELIAQKMDTVVTDEQIVTYFKEHESSFILNEDIVQFHFVKIPVGAPKLDRARELFEMNNKDDKQELVEYGFQYAEDFYLKDSTWYELTDLYRQIPIEMLKLRTMCQNLLAGEIEDEEHIYLLRINGYIEKRELAPLSFAKERIKKLILNDRKMDLLARTYDDLFKDAVKSGSFEKYPTP